MKRGHFARGNTRLLSKGDLVQYKVLKCEFQRAMLKAKASYKAKLENKLQANDIRGVWQGLQAITDYKTKHHVLDSDPSLPGRLKRIPA